MYLEISYSPQEIWNIICDAYSLDTGRLTDIFILFRLFGENYKVLVKNGEHYEALRSVMLRYSQLLPTVVSTGPGTLQRNLIQIDYKQWRKHYSTATWRHSKHVVQAEFHWPLFRELATAVGDNEIARLRHRVCLSVHTAWIACTGRNRSSWQRHPNPVCRVVKSGNVAEMDSQKRLIWTEQEIGAIHCFLRSLRNLKAHTVRFGYSRCSFLNSSILLFRRMNWLTQQICRFSLSLWTVVSLTEHLHLSHCMA